jgi:uncharacterized YccA/Bax inhibitor family protein
VATLFSTGTFGPLVAVFGVGLATFFLAMDFDQAAKAAAMGFQKNRGVLVLV